MNTLTVLMIMVAVAAALLIGAIIVDRQLERRMQRRRAAEAGADPGAARKSDAADAVIQMLNSASEVMRRSLRTDEGDDSHPGKGS